MTDAVGKARAAVLREFRWIHGHSDVWRLTEDPLVFADVVTGLAALARGLGAEAIAGIETRGVLFGAPVARSLGLGFHVIRKTEGLFAGARDTVASEADYRGLTHTLRSRGAFAPGERVVLVDDWIERGSQAAAARTLIELAGAELAGVIVIVDESDGALPLRALVTADELPDWDGS